MPDIDPAHVLDPHGDVVLRTHYHDNDGLPDQLEVVAAPTQAVVDLHLLRRWPVGRTSLIYNGDTLVFGTPGLGRGRVAYQIYAWDAQERALRVVRLPDVPDGWYEESGEPKPAAPLPAASDEPREHPGTGTGCGLSDDRLREIAREQVADINLIIRGDDPANILAVLEDRAKDWDGADARIAADYRTVARHIAAQGDVSELQLREPSEDELAAFKAAFTASADQPARWLPAPGALPATMLWPSDFDIEPDNRITPVRFVDVPEDVEDQGDVAERDGEGS